MENGSDPINMLRMKLEHKRASRSLVPHLAKPETASVCFRIFVCISVFEFVLEYVSVHIHLSVSLS